MTDRTNRQTEREHSMTTIDPTTTLGELVTAHPQFAREFELLELDHCCGGQRTLADACVARSLDAQTTADELAHAVVDEPAPEWSAMDLTDLVDHLESTHHRYLGDELPRLSALVAKIVSLHGDRRPELEVDTHLHIHKENNLLCPGVVRIESELAAASRTM